MPDSPTSLWHSYSDVDAATDPTSLRDQLDDIAAVDVVAAGKRRSLELLGLEPGAKVLDVGCGNGPELEQLAGMVGSEGRVVGLDRSSTLIADAQARGLSQRGPIELVVGNAEALPFDDEQFDACRIDRTLQHLDRPEAALREMARVSRAGGRIVATESRWGLVAPGLDQAVTNRVFQIIETGDERRHWLGFLLPPMFEMAGLHDVRLERADGAISDFDQLMRFSNLPWSLTQAMRTGALSHEQTETWCDSLRELAGGGEARIHVMIFNVVGIR